MIEWGDGSLTFFQFKPADQLNLMNYSGFQNERSTTNDQLNLLKSSGLDLLINSNLVHVGSEKLKNYH